MSVAILLDRNKVVSAILKPYIPLALMKFSMGEPANSDVWYRDGWIFYELKVSGKYPALSLGKVNTILPTYGTDGAVILAYIHEVKDYFLLFFETEKGTYTTYLGLELDADGKLRYVNNPENKNTQIAPPGSIANRDTIVAGVYIINDAGTKKAKILLDKVDFATRTRTRIVDYTDTITYSLNPVSAYALEPKGVTCRWGVAFYTVGQIGYFYDAPSMLIKAGLPDPRGLLPW